MRLAEMQKGEAKGKTDKGYLEKGRKHQCTDKNVLGTRMYTLELSAYQLRAILTTERCPYGDLSCPSVQLFLANFVEYYEHISLI